MEIVRLNKDDYDQWLSVLNTVFTRQNKMEMDFEKVLPKMCVRDDLNMNKHLAVKEDGKICALLGIYPIPVKAGNTELLFSTVGNIATLPEYEGKGYMRALMCAAMDELARIGADASRLSGARQRYNRYGYEAAGISYHFTINEHTVKNCSSGDDIITFGKLSGNDRDALTYIRMIREKMPFYAIRSCDEACKGEYDALCSFWHTPYIALKNGRPVGYFTVSYDRRTISDIGAGDLQTVKAIVYAWQRNVGDSVTLTLPATDFEGVRYFSAVSAGMQLLSPSLFKIIHFDKVADALIKLKKSSGAYLPQGKSVIGIKDWGNLLICCKGDDVFCEKTDKAAAITLDKLEATRFLFGPFAPETVADTDGFLTSVLPLPLPWCAVDRV